MTGEEFKAWREAEGLSARALGEIFDLHENTIYKLQLRDKVPGHIKMACISVSLSRKGFINV